jgi:hypothetical protein
LDSTHNEVGGKKQISIYHRDEGKKSLGQTSAKKGETLCKKECPCRTTNREGMLIM